jgi:hypothetical protein
MWKTPLNSPQKDIGAMGGGRKANRVYAGAPQLNKIKTGRNIPNIKNKVESI